ncbi:hypothetical protein [Burkholderia glumae]|uniref:hypothetical protein n=1 Tax=Burkholderia glumae TaxID=337 RepID=UPI0012FB6121|nr:hypothetical protein [Burkholderia glumae]MCM2495618.1 hypothetical protein [Burkholderia glumae]MCM2546629.1 hypothetical protein [Burkholderia glumae]
MIKHDADMPTVSINQDGTPGNLDNADAGPRCMQRYPGPGMPSGPAKACSSRANNRAAVTSKRREYRGGARYGYACRIRARPMPPAPRAAFGAATRYPASLPQRLESSRRRNVRNRLHDKFDACRKFNDCSWISFPAMLQCKAKSLYRKQ